MQQNRVRVTICGKSYTLQTEENPAYVEGIAADLDRRINRFMDENETASMVSAAVMVALGLIDEEMKSVSDADHIRSQLKGYVEEAAAARIEADQLKRENAQLKRTIESLKNDLDLYSLRDKVDARKEKQ